MSFSLEKYVFILIEEPKVFSALDKSKANQHKYLCIFYNCKNYSLHKRRWEHKEKLFMIIVFSYGESFSHNFPLELFLAIAIVRSSNASPFVE